MGGGTLAGGPEDGMGDDIAGPEDPGPLVRTTGDCGSFGLTAGWLPDDGPDWLPGGKLGRVAGSMNAI
jgi:hypothetical protein